MRHAAIEFRSERYIKVATEPPHLWDKIAGLYRTGDDRWVRIHTNFAHHRDGILALLDAQYDRDAVQRSSAQVERRRIRGGRCRAQSRRHPHPQSRTMGRPSSGPSHRCACRFSKSSASAMPLPKPLPAGARPLSGVRVLDLTRIIAGPVGARTLAAHGADVLTVTSPNLPSIPSLVIDTGRGKLSAVARPQYNRSPRND